MCVCVVEAYGGELSSSAKATAVNKPSRGRRSRIVAASSSFLFGTRDD